MAPSPATDDAGGRRALEGLLASLIPADARRTADVLIALFGDPLRALCAERDALAQATGSAEVADFIVAVRAAGLEMLRQRTLARPLTSTAEVIEYLQVGMVYLPVETLRVLFFDTANRLLQDVVLWEGTIDRTPAYPREVMRRAMFGGAAAIILVHNHPSGDPTPTGEDVRVSREIVAAGQALGVAVHDHIIVGRAGWTSLRERGLL